VKLAAYQQAAPTAGHIVLAEILLRATLVNIAD
jgi:hypothetical protein